MTTFDSGAETLDALKRLAKGSRQEHRDRTREVELRRTHRAAAMGDKRAAERLRAMREE